MVVFYYYYMFVSHITHNRSIATIKASFIVSFDRICMIDYCITNLAAIKYSNVLQNSFKEHAY